MPDRMETVDVGPVTAGWPDPRCGTPAGATAHNRRGEPACPVCAKAGREWMRAYRIQRGLVHRVTIDVAVLADLLRTATTPALTAAAADLGKPVVTYLRDGVPLEAAAVAAPFGAEEEPRA